jgi:hypothetical protein
MLSSENFQIWPLVKNPPSYAPGAGLGTVKPPRGRGFSTGIFSKTPFYLFLVHFFLATTWRTRFFRLGGYPPSPSMPTSASGGIVRFWLLAEIHFESK